MQQFASRDLMVTELPEESVGEWGASGECGDCTGCTNNTKTERPRPKPKPKPRWNAAAESDLPELQDQLRAMLD